MGLQLHVPRLRPRTIHEITEVPGRYAGGRRAYHVYEARTKLAYPDGSWEWNDDDWRPNVLVDEGEKDMIDVYLKQGAHNNKYLALISGSAPAETAVFSGLTESTTPGSNGYNRQQILNTDWGATALDVGDNQSSAAEKTFGPNSGTTWTVAHVVMTTAATGTAGLFLMYVTTTTTSVGNNVAFKVTLRWKMQ